MLPFGVTIPATVPQGSEIPEGLMNNPVYLPNLVPASHKVHCYFVMKKMINTVRISNRCLLGDHMGHRI
jgi:hypothetical protein